MESENRKVVLYIGISLDGYIAGENDELEFLDTVNEEGEDYGYDDFIATIDTVVIGRRTYEKVMSFDEPFWHKDRNCIVLSKSMEGSNENVTFYNGTVESLIGSLREKPGKNIYCDGGADVIQQLLRANLIDRMTISIVPYLLGKGIQLFGHEAPEIPLTLIDTKSYKSGLVQLTYERKM